MAVVYVSPGLLTGGDNGLTAADAFRSWASFAAAGCAAGSDVRVNADEYSTSTVTLGSNILSTGYPNYNNITTITGYSTDWTTPTLRWRDGSGSPANTDGFTIAIPATATNITFRYLGARNFSRDGLIPTTGQAGARVFYHCKFNNNGRNGVTIYNASTTLANSQWIFCEMSYNGASGITGGVANQSHYTLKHCLCKNNVTYQAYCNSNIFAYDSIFIGGQYGVECSSYIAHLIRCVIDGASVNGYGAQSYAFTMLEDCAITNCGRAIYSNHAVATLFQITGLVRYNNTNADNARYSYIIERDVTDTNDIYIDRNGGDYRQKVSSVGRNVADILIGDVTASNTTYGIQGADIPCPAPEAFQIAVTAWSTNSIRIEWGASAGAISYVVYRDDIAISPTLKNVSKWIDENATPDTYEYKVVATNDTGDTTSNVVTYTKTVGGIGTVYQILLAIYRALFNTQKIEKIGDTYYLNTYDDDDTTLLASCALKTYTNLDIQIEPLDATTRLRTLVSGSGVDIPGTTVSSLLTKIFKKSFFKQKNIQVSSEIHEALYDSDDVTKIASQPLKRFNGSDVSAPVNTVTPTERGRSTL